MSRSIPGDRTVHGRSGACELVRYDRAGKWYFEQGDERRQVSLDEAVMVAVQWLAEPGAQVFLDRPGGTTFDARVRRKSFAQR